jgi:hypothetical protein
MLIISLTNEEQEWGYLLGNQRMCNKVDGIKGVAE